MVMSIVRRCWVTSCDARKYQVVRVFIHSYPQGIAITKSNQYDDSYEVPTPIQMYCLPSIKQNYDVLACAQTGTYLQPPRDSVPAYKIVIL